MTSTGARYEIAVDGTPRTYRDSIEGAWAAATNLKSKQPNVEITVRDPRPAPLPRSSIR